MYSGTVRRVSRQDIKLVTVSLEMEDNDPKNDLYKECFCAGSLKEYISWLNADKKSLNDDGGAPKHSPDKHFQSKRTHEQACCNEATIHGESLENNTSDSSLEKKSKKLKSCIPSSYPCFSTPQIADCSNPPDPKDVSDKNLKDGVPGSNKTRAFIPIGPGFQAEIPVWIAPTKKGKFYGSPGDSQTLRWLGTGVWPTYSLKKTVHYKNVGEGRSDSCTCASPKSTSCIRKHIKEARELLEKEIGCAFSTWKFDQMGEVVAKSWTAKEEQRFVALVKKNPLSSSEGFWECASKSFPRKRVKDLISYYQNVYLISRMRMLTNSSADHIDSDDDHYDDFLAG